MITDNISYSFILISRDLVKVIGEDLNLYSVLQGPWSIYNIEQNVTV